MEDYYTYLKTTPGLLPAGAVLNVTGYSLGAHMATVFTELHGNEVNHTYTFNAAGRGTFDTSVGSLTDMIAYFRATLANPNAATGEVPRAAVDRYWNEYQAALAAQNTPWPANLYDVSDLPLSQPDPRYHWAVLATQTHFRTQGASLLGTTNPALDAKITQLYGRATHNDSEWVANSGVHATPIKLFIEDQPNIQYFGVDWFDKILGLKSDYGATHSITLVADALAVMTVFERLGMPTATASDLDAMYRLLGATSYQRGTGFVFADGEAEGDSLEKAVEALHKLFLNQTITLTYNRTSVGGFGDMANRTQFYEALDAINTHLDENPASYQFKSLVGASLDSLKVNALLDSPVGLAYRYALTELSPFVVLGADYTPHNTNNQLNLYNPTTHTGSLTTEYLKDRAAFLINKINANTLDQTRLGVAYVDYAGSPQHFRDLASGDRLFLTSDPSVIDRAINNGATPDISNILFGGEGADTITGGTKWDKLYGGDGNDTLTGGQGNDYLEGGQGTDRYNFTANHGLDQLLDTDSQGTLYYDGIALNGGTAITPGATTYRSPDNRFTYTLIRNTGQPDTLLIQTPGGQITVKDYQPGQLNLTLQDTPPPNPTSIFTGTNTHNADLWDTGTPLGLAGGGVLDLNWLGYAPLGQTIYNDGTNVGGMYFISRTGQGFPDGTQFDALIGNDGDDFLLGNPGAQDFTIDAGLGNDWIITDYNDRYSAYEPTTIYAQGPGTTVDGGPGHDAIQGGFRNDTLNGDQGHDQIEGRNGDDYIDGDTGNDWLTGEQDDDILIGGPDTTTDTDHDILLGGSGSDYLEGGAGNDHGGNTDAANRRHLVEQLLQHITHRLAA